jgi:hypothetical protein
VDFFAILAKKNRDSERRSKGHFGFSRRFEQERSEKDCDIDIAIFVRRL